jgi:hypothetical protein
VSAGNAFGTARNGAVRGIGYHNVNISAFKEFRTYHTELGRRFDDFNVFNM